MAMMQMGQQNAQAGQVQSKDQAGQPPQQGGDVNKLVEGVGLGLSKLVELLPPEMQGKMQALASQYEKILSGQEVEMEDDEEEESPSMQAQQSMMGGKADMMSGGRGKPMV
ncbi:MAG: hypothetical protein KA413_00375 [Candidatus Methylopumilus sp.]|nr:hypothetical protein [Candidatus Methylopumilus sp.]